MNLLDFIHGSYVHVRRVNVLSKKLAEFLPLDCSVLDIGCGDGLLSERITQKRHDVTICGADVLVRASATIPVTQINGLHLPWEDSSVDIAMLVDVLHHSDEPMTLLQEALRVSRRAILIKDHNLNGFLAYTRLSLMDRVGNARHGVSLPRSYFTKAEWEDIFNQLPLKVERITSDFRLYPLPLEWIFGGRLHFISLLQRENRSING